MALHRSTFVEVGEFDERLGPGTVFPGAEDNDLGFRLLEAGYSIHYVPEAVLYHKAWRSAREYLPLRWNYGLSQGAFLAKHMRLSDRYMLGRLRADLYRHGNRLVRQDLRRSRGQIYADAIYILGLLCGAARWLLTQPKKP
jgi:GT2 family glycosyltransferase